MAVGSTQVTKRDVVPSGTVTVNGWGQLVTIGERVSGPATVKEILGKCWVIVLVYKFVTFKLVICV